MIVKNNMKQTIVIALIVLLALCSFATARRRKSLAHKTAGLSCYEQAEKRFNDGNASCIATKKGCDALGPNKNCLPLGGVERRKCEAINVQKMNEKDLCYRDNRVNTCQRYLSDAFKQEQADCDKKAKA